MRPANLLSLAAVAVVASVPAAAQSSDPFLRTLTADGSLDRPGLAGFLGRVCERLQASHEGVGLLQLAAESSGPDRPYVVKATSELERRYDEYTAALAEFEAAVERLVRQPAAERRLYAALTAGQKACWVLDGHVELARSYGVNAGRVREVLASAAACSRLRHVAFQPRVVEIVDRAIVENRDRTALERENLALREELAALEQLLEDLRDLD